MEHPHPHPHPRPHPHGLPNCTVVAVNKTEGIFENPPHPHHKGVCAAFGRWNDTVNSTGMSTLEVHTNPRVPDGLQAYAAGLLEGNVTAHRIYQYYVNAFRNVSYKADGSSVTYGPANGTLMPPNAIEFLRENERFTWKMIKKSPDCPYWHTIKLAKIQMFGIYAGQKDAPEGRNLSVYQIVMMNYVASLGDFAKYKQKAENVNKKFLEKDHCSAFIKVTENNTDLLVAHTTFSGFHTMSRIWKMYSLHYHVNDRSNKPLPVHAVSFSSYPATIHSVDDWYQTS